MKIYVISALIGLVAGLLDIIPMIIQKMNAKAIVSAFLQYFFVSIVIVHIKLPGLTWWMQGIVVSFALALPVIIAVSDSDKKAVPVISVMSVVLGGLISVAWHFLKRI
jgi:hypothetical protein